jgi:putative DNA primase/helicase
MLRLCGVRVAMFDAPVAGTGKSYLAELIGLIAIGRKPPAMTAGWNDDELDKRLGAVARLGDQIILIDNIERELKSDTLCTMISSGFIRTRILGQSETVDLSASAVVVATGNNIQMYTDLTRRTLCVRLNAVQERPELRSFHRQPHQMVMADRAKYIVAALNIFRAHVQDRKELALAPLQGFEYGYSRVRGSLVNARLPDPALAADLSRTMDAGRIDDGAVFQALESLFPNGVEFTAREVQNCANQSLFCGPNTEAREVLEGVFGSKSPIGTGKILGRMVDRIIDGIQLQRRRQRNSTLAFKMVRRSG